MNLLTSRMINLMIMLSFTLSLNSCASPKYSPTKPLPRLENRTLRIDKDSGKLIYQYQVCRRKFLKKKCKFVRDEYDLTNEETRLKLYNMGFVLQKRRAITR